MRDAGTDFRKFDRRFVADSAHDLDHVAPGRHRDFVAATCIKVMPGSGGCTLGHCADGTCGHELIPRIGFHHSYLCRHELPSGRVRQLAFDHRRHGGIGTLRVQWTKQRT